MSIESQLARTLTLTREAEEAIARAEIAIDKVTNKENENE